MTDPRRYLTDDPFEPGAAAKSALTFHELVVAARRKLTQEVWDYLVGGAETETSVKRNRQALDSVAFRPRVLTDVSEVDAGGSLLGNDLRIPVILAPIGSLQLFEEGGGATAAKAAEDFGIMNFVSSVCLPGLEGSAEASDSPKVYQLYLADDEDWMRGLIRRVQSAGYNGFCLTVDTQVYSRRERDILKRWRPPSVGEATTRAAPLNYQARMTWDLVKRIKDEFDIPLILKGIATAEDAGLACEHGVDVVYVSNHGGRQLDHVRGALDTLPEVVAEVNGRAQVVVDGGFLRGTDVVKAKILGADAVGIGRLECIAMAAGGREGVVRMLRILEHEIVTCLGLLGVRNWDQLDASYLHRALPVDTPGVLSALPFLDLDSPYR